MTLLLSLACATVHLPEPTDAMVAAAPGTSLESLQQGRQLVLDHCANCHAPPSPAVTHAARWPETFTVMQGKAKLTPEQAALVDAYLRAGATLPAE